MTHDRRRGNGGTGDGGDQGEAIDDDSGPDEPTVVIAPDEFLIGALGRLAGGLRGTADRSDGLREMVTEAAADPVLLTLLLDELDEGLRDLEMLAGGGRRGVARLRAYLKAKQASETPDF